jgi:hypothetical protein
MTDLLTSLRSIEVSLARLGRVELIQSLRPGLSAESSALMVEACGFEPSDDIPALFGWHNGCSWEGDPKLGKMWVYPPFIFVYLQDAIRIYCELKRSGNWNPDWFPVLLDDAGDFYAVDQSEAAPRAVRHIRNEFLHRPVIEYSSLGAMARTWAAAFDNGALYVDPSDDCLNIHDDEFSSLAARMNPEISWWSDPELA